MKEKQTKELDLKNVWLSSLKKFFIIMLCFVVLFFFIIMSLFFISPKTAAKFFGSMNMKNAQETCLITEYNKNSSAANLYNLVIFESEQNNLESELIYLSMLFARDDYNEFCKKTDSASLSAINNNKSLIAISCNVNSYLINQKVKCMYNIGIESGAIIKFILPKVEEKELAENSFSTFIELVLSDKKISDNKKLSILNSLKGYDIFDAVEAKISKLQSIVKSENISKHDLIIYSYALVGNCRGLYLTYLNIYEKESVEFKDAKQNYEDAIKIYNESIS